MRAPDVRIELRNGEKWVLVDNDSRGASTFDKPGLPHGPSWSYYSYPKEQSSRVVWQS